MAEIKYVFYGDFSDIPKLEATWNAVVAPHVFQSFSFVSRWFTITRDCTQPAVVVAFEDERPFGIFPACVVNRRGLRMLCWAPRRIADYGDILFNPDAPVSSDIFFRRAVALAKTLSRCRTVSFPHVREDAICFPVLKQAYLAIAQSSAPYLLAGRPFDQVMHDVCKLKKNQKTNTERNIRRLRDLGRLEFTLYRDFSQEAARSLDHILKHKKIQFNNKKIMIDYHGYAEWYLDQLIENKMSFVASLSLNGSPIAGLFGFIWNERLYYLVSAYDKAASKQSPGRVLVYQLLKSLSNDIMIWDFTIGDEVYKMEWAENATRIVSFIEPNFTGHMVLGATRAQALGVRVLARLKTWRAYRHVTPKFGFPYLDKMRQSVKPSS